MSDDDFDGDFSDTDPAFTGGFFGWGESSHEGHEEQEGWAAGLPAPNDNFVPSAPVPDDTPAPPTDPATAAMREDYFEGGEFVNLGADGRRAVDWEAAASWLNASEADVERMRAEWARTGEVRGLIVLHVARPREGGAK